MEPLPIERSTSRADPVKAELRNKTYELFDAALYPAGIHKRHRGRRALFGTVVSNRPPGMRTAIVGLSTAFLTHSVAQKDEWLPRTSWLGLEAW